ncbi:uncharacterized protein LOC124163285 isoform X2 [Ischnura elegans]|uniref:uncharacterized protein LOC124163285 isoform X2 n=1 Tax=Ischnura elegans TaxID=197161 RepID=UPI001ED88B78|nr:uncharacterized protein LOC124163285 isoform X2 [Ischnura elegans]
MKDIINDRIRALRSQLDESRFHMLLSNILLSSLKEALDNEGLSSSIAEKIKKVLLFGNLKEYLDAAHSGDEFSTGSKGLLGILKNTEYGPRVKLTDEERPTVLDELRGIISMTNELIYQTFARYHQNDYSEATDENLKGLLESLKLVTTSSLMQNHDEEITEYIRKCYEEILKCEEVLDVLVKMKLQGGEPLFTTIKRHNSLEAEAIQIKSKELLAEIKNEIFSEGGTAALEIIQVKQKEEMEAKKLEIKRLKEHLSKYESLKDDGFETVVDEYLLVVQDKKEKEKQMEEMFL